MRADVIIITFNSAGRIARCLQALLPQLAGGHTLTVVDNASHDDSADVVKRLAPSARVIRNVDNPGFGRAVNRGAQGGRGDVLVLLNDDVVPAPGFLQALLAPLLADPLCGMVAGLLTFPGTDIVETFGVTVDIGLSAWPRGYGAPLTSMYGQLTVPSGGAAAYRRVAWESAGGFDPHLFAYWEDVDLGLRLLAAGWTTAAAPDARGEHESGASFAGASAFQRRLAAYGRGFVLGRFGARGASGWLRAACVDGVQIASSLVTSRDGAVISERRRGWRDGRASRHALPAAALDDEWTLRRTARRLVSLARTRISVDAG